MRKSTMTMRNVACGEDQEPAKASCKARWIEARALKPGDVILRHSGGLVKRDNVQEVRVGWWCRAYVFANGGRDVLVFRETERIQIEREPLYHIDAVSVTGQRVRMKSCAASSCCATPTRHSPRWSSRKPVSSACSGGGRTAATCSCSCGDGVGQACSCRRHHAPPW